ncbi:MAG: MCE family protein [Magnetococcales bacterium]|nr:MCE family protein [Magnetococcales bacterium]
MEQQPLSELPTAIVRYKREFPIVWLVPMVAAVIAGWLAVHSWLAQGELVTIAFKNAAGVQAGKTRIKYRDIDIGLVEQVQLDLATVDDHDGHYPIQIRGRIYPHAATFLNSGSQFWVVRPELGLTGISGLTTLMEGVHIEVDPGSGDHTNTFTGLETPPVVRQNTPGASYVLMADSLGSITHRSPVYYRGLPVGEIQGYRLTDDRRAVRIHVFIKAPYHTLVRPNSHFWNVSGIRMNLDADGMKAHTESLQSLLLGGIAFDSPPSPETTSADQVVPDYTPFRLYSDFETIGEEHYTKQIDYILYFDGSVRGLSEGAPVEFRGLKVGSVTQVRMEYDSSQSTIRIPVLVRIEPERISEIGAANTTPEQIFEQLINKGLRAQLQTGNLLTGQRFIELAMLPEIPLRRFNPKQPEIPTAPSSLDEMTQSVGSLLDKLQRIPWERIGTGLEKTVRGAGQLLSAPETMAALQALKNNLQQLEQITKKLDQRLGPLTEELTRTTEAARLALEQSRSSLATTEKWLAPEAPMYQTIYDTLQEVTDAARALRALTGYLERHPNAVLFGKERSTGGEKP